MAEIALDVEGDEDSSVALVSLLFNASFVTASCEARYLKFCELHVMCLLLGTERGSQGIRLWKNAANFVSKNPIEGYAQDD